MAEPLFCSSEAQFPLKHGCSCKCFRRDCKRLCVKNVFPHLYIYEFSSNLHKVGPKRQGNALVFPYLTTIRRRNACVLNMYFCVFWRIMVRFLPDTLHISRSKTQKRHAAEKTELARITWDIAKQYVKFDATKKHNEHNILSYKTYNTTQHNINLTTLKEKI